MDIGLKEGKTLDNLLNVLLVKRTLQHWNIDFVDVEMLVFSF